MRRIWNSSAVLVLLTLSIGLLSLVTACAHEVRPAYLELREEMPNEYSVLLKTPMRGDARLALSAVFSGKIENITPIVSRPTGNAMVQTWRMRTIEPLQGQQVLIEGLRSTMTDALVRVEFAAGGAWVARLTPGAPEATIPVAQTRGMVAATYLKLGIEHILLGFDHLLFVLALLIITQGIWALVKTVTSFTIAHSITLALATLGFVHVPSPPVEAVIALSIAFVAVEIVHVRQGRRSLSARAPWLVAFAFGLLHGFGFAGSLSEIGLPVGQIPLALLFFNVGVEIGQLLFIAAVLALAALIRSAKRPLPAWLHLVPPYAIGTIAMFWVIERVAAF
ncbi:HupE / UreJ protein [Rhizobium mongolense subsp. loessense]|uniref:HupE / UreJ protein n=1 Tax=Rhizobium mongolense subsp. loessense TaxID=158890 RepID=A0A1G4S2E4_9HYPH|nr:HupE/UreJ family protein [Rhizobium mongolense]SCW63107.1 HupE / UreJ protein [Rhizobium mongolense subsp. loessense]